MSLSAMARSAKGFFRVTLTADQVSGRKGFSAQAAKRMATIWRDQHGREWVAEMDTSPGALRAPCTPLRPNNWSAPILPPAQFIECSQGMGAPHCTIHYDQWAEHQGALNAEWQGELTDIAQRMFPNSWAREITEQNPLLLAKVGPKPYAVEFVRAAAQGNRWVLGQSPHRPSWVTDALFATIPRPKRHTIEYAGATEFPDAEDEADESFGGALEDLNESTSKRRRAAA